MTFRIEMSYVIKFQYFRLHMKKMRILLIETNNENFWQYDYIWEEIHWNQQISGVQLEPQLRKYSILNYN